ncbi:MAG: leucyl aminopeptidase [Betaproteobacteria bacterium RIFCSPLOWO2_02_64_14]|nr:MAG: leucyl aminopeptidase [Betaproteobacteria bacterium RIFCSPLOWO2_02_64_14]
MEFSTKCASPVQIKSACAVVGVFEPRKLSTAAAALDRAAKGYLSAIIRGGDMEGKAGTTLLLHHVPNVACDRVLLVGLGPEREFRDRNYREAIAAALRVLNSTGATEATLHLTELAVPRRDGRWRITHATAVAREAVYRFDKMKSKPEGTPPALRRLVLGVRDRGELRRAAAGLEQGLAVAHGVSLARDLGNLPGNVCTPAYLAEQAREVAKRYRMKITVLEREDMEKLGMGALLSVAAGSAQPPKLIVLEHRSGPRSQRPVALVGKGITFDTGGISLKPASEMDEMKFDMCGAASVLGTIKAAAEMKLPVNVVGLIPTSENMPGGRATKPGDIVTTMSGQTVEVLNTDAEGRLILCDALTYAERFEPAAVVDIATLTGACVIALGHVASGLFANDDALARELLAAGELACDRAWRMPLWDEYQEQLKSNFADFANIGGRPAGSVTAACFLARFTKKFKWAHLDIAGTAWKSGKEKGASGRPVPLLTQFLVNRAGRGK